VRIRRFSKVGRPWRRLERVRVLLQVFVPDLRALVEGGMLMKNTGKRIFFAVVVVAISNLVLLVSAGAFASQR